MSEPINDEKCLGDQKWTEKSRIVFRASKHKLDLKEEKKVFMICILCCCVFRLIGSRTKGILALLCLSVLSIQKNDLIVLCSFHVII